MAARGKRATVRAERLETAFYGVVQLLAIGIAVLFGIYTVLAFYAAEAAISQAQMANQLAVLGLCAQTQALGGNALCANLLAAASDTDLLSIAAALFPSSALSGNGISSTSSIPTTTISTSSSAAESTSTSTKTSGGTSDALSSTTTLLDGGASTITILPGGSIAASTTFEASASAAPTTTLASGSQSSVPGSSGGVNSVALGVGIGLGVPSVIAAGLSIWLTLARWQTEVRARRSVE